MASQTLPGYGTGYGTGYGNPPLVSVIIPAFNSGNWLAQAIESALAQTYHHVQIVVVNDGSTLPLTASTAQEYLPRITYIERENGGVAAARNTGVEAANGELIALLDQDDLWLPRKLETEVRAFLKHPHVGLVHSSYHLIDEEGQTVTTPDDANWQSLLKEREYKPLPALLVDVPICSATTLFPRRLLDEVGGFDSTLPGTDDWDLWLRIAARGYTFYCVGEPLAEYRRHPANTSHDIDLMVGGVLRTLDKFYTLLNVPPEAQAWRHRAYAERHAWAAALFYGEARLAEAASHLRSAAHYNPDAIARSRFFQSLIYASGQQPTPVSARAAVKFVMSALKAEKLPPAASRKLRAHAALVLARHAGSKALAAHKAARLIVRHPQLLTDPELWAAGRMIALKAATRRRTG